MQGRLPSHRLVALSSLNRRKSNAAMTPGKPRPKSRYRLMLKMQKSNDPLEEKVSSAQTPEKYRFILPSRHGSRKREADGGRENTCKETTSFNNSMSTLQRRDTQYQSTKWNQDKRASQADNEDIKFLMEERARSRNNRVSQRQKTTEIVNRSSAELHLKMNEYIRSEQMLDHLINTRPTLTHETCDSLSHRRLPASESKLKEPAESKADLKVLRDKID